MKSLSSREILKDLKADGWKVVRIKGSHHHLRHSEKPGLITVPHPKRKMHPKTAAGIYKTAESIHMFRTQLFSQAATDKFREMGDRLNEIEVDRTRVIRRTSRSSPMPPTVR